MNMQVDYDNYMAINVLENLGIVDPHQDQIDLIELILSNITSQKRIAFSAKLNARENSYLYWIAKGKSPMEIAKFYNTAMINIENCKKSIIAKIGYKNMMQTNETRVA